MSRGRIIRFIIRFFFSLLLLLFIIIPPDEYKILERKTDEEIILSFGDEILINKDSPWFKSNNEENWKQECFKNLQDKQNNLENYTNSCPQDAEAGIYLNNQTAKQSGKTIKIAVSIPISANNGQGVFRSYEILQGVRLAQEKTNEYGIKINNDETIFLEVGIIDDGWDDTDDLAEEKKAQTVANYLGSNTDDNNVVAVIGHFSSDATQAAAPVYRKNKLVAISPTSTARRKSNDRNKIVSRIKNLKNIFPWFKSDEWLKLNKYIFRTAPNDSIAIERLISQDSSIKKIIIVYDSVSTYSKLYKQEFQQQFEKQGGTIIDVCAFEGLTTNQANNCINKIEQSKPDAILFVFSTDKSSQLINIETREQPFNFFEKIANISRLKLLASDGLYKEEIAKIAKKLIISVARLTEKDDPNNSNDIPLNWRGAMAYDATRAITKAIEKVSNECSNLNNQKKCRQQIQTALSSEGMSAPARDLDSTVTFINGDRQKDNNLGVPLQVKDGDFVNIPSARTSR